MNIKPRPALLAAAALALAACAPAPRVVATTRAPSAATIATIPLAWSNVHVVAGPGGVVLVDAGSRGELGAIEAGLGRLGHRLADVRCVVLTHGHADHAGTAAAMQRRGVRVIAGAGDAGVLARGHNDRLRPTRWTARVLARLVPDDYLPIAPDHLVADRRDLADCGVAGEVVALPGHTPGSVIVLVDGGRIAAVGDLVLGGALGGAVRPHVPDEHYFHDDRAANHANLAALVAADVELLLLGHGGPVSRARVLARWPALAPGPARDTRVSAGPR